MNRALTFSEIWERQADKITRYCHLYLTKKFGINVIIDEDTARLIALCTMSKGETIWLEGKEKSKSHLSVKLVVQSEAEPEVPEVL